MSFLSFEGGNIIQTESDQIIREKGRALSTSEVVRTSPGRLPCKHVLHVAGPKWNSGTPEPRSGDDPTMEEDLLYDAVTNVLREAKRMKMKSVSIPAISSGIYGFPIHLCAKTMTEASIEFCKKNTSSSLKEIRFTNIDDRACNAFLQYFEKGFGAAHDREDAMGSIESGSEGKHVNRDKDCM